MKRDLTGNWARFAFGVALALSLFHLYTGAVGVLPHMQQRAIHVFFGFVLIFAIYGRKKGKTESSIPLGDLVLMVATTIFCLYIFFNYEYFMIHRGAPIRTGDLILGVIAVLVVIEAARRTSGWIFPIFTIVMFIYALFGQYIPGYLGHGGFQFGEVIAVVYLYDQALWGSLTGATASIVSMFIIFGALLHYTGGGQTFMDIAVLAGGRARGGPALVAVMASALFGTVTGSSVANVATTGNFTIPMMKRLGYPARFAGAVEAAASTGGQFMPPVMGSAAFIMAEILSIAYIEIAAAAAIPAILYFVAILAQVRFEALKRNLPPMPEEDIPSARAVIVWRRLSPLLLPVAVLMYFLISGYSAYTSAFYAVATAMVLYLLVDVRLDGMKQRLMHLIAGLRQGGVVLTEIIAIVATCNVFIGIMFFTGLGSKISGLISGVGGESLFPALLIAAIVSTILGMGIPTVAAYILAASIVGPSLILIGVPPLAAHLFLFYYACLSAITPPVCIAVFTASMIARAPWMDIAKTTMRIGFLVWLLPFLFVYDPVFLLQGEPASIVLSIITGVIGIICVAAGTVGYLRGRLPVFGRVLLVVAGLLFFVPGWSSDIAGMLLIGVAILGTALWPRILRKYHDHP